MAVGNFRAGKGGRVEFIESVSTVCKMMKYSVKERGNNLDTTNFECWTSAYGSSGSGGGICFEQGLIGVQGADFDISGNYDAAQNPYDDPPGLYVRDDGPETVLYTNRTDDIYYDFLETRFLNTTLDVSVDGMVAFSVSGMSQYTFIRPTGSVLVA